MYLIHEIENREDLDAWLAQHYQVLFEEELSGWYTDESLWPTERSLALFHEWIHVDVHPPKRSGDQVTEARIRDEPRDEPQNEGLVAGEWVKSG